MKIALINENSQASKNAIIESALKKVVEPMGFEVKNYGMYTAEDTNQLTYEGAMLACNSFPGVICGHVEDALDAYTFAQINDGNAIAIPFAKGFGWGGELNLEYIFEKLFCEKSGQGYPRERAIPEQKNKKILDQVKRVTYRNIEDILQELDSELVQGAFKGENFRKYFFEDCKSEKLADCVRRILG